MDPGEGDLPQALVRCRLAAAGLGAGSPGTRSASRKGVPGLLPPGRGLSIQYCLVPNMSAEVQG